MAVGVSRAAHVREVLTGYQHGSAELALPGEPHPQYVPGTTLMAGTRPRPPNSGSRPSTVRRWAATFRVCGPAGLVHDGTRSEERAVASDRPAVDRHVPHSAGGHVTASRPTRAIILAEITSRLGEQYGAGVVASPSKTVGYELLRELVRGTNALEGSTKGKRSIADRPPEVYGRLRATRPGEYVLLDTTRLDVFAMEPVTCQWVQCELTIDCARSVNDR